ncbi:hypothetical protein BYT27DRAFT_7191009 [Phlegmacium glaucopus]|nr:hypothetical protein BYT27DRAFT_7191009 [Phlegmacium glaucopus]
MGEQKYRQSLHLPVSSNKDLLTTDLSKRDASGHSSSKGGTLTSSNRSTAMNDSYLPEFQPMTLAVSSSKCAPPALTFALSRETSISMNLCGQVVTYNLKSLGQNPQVIIELLKVTKSECASWMIASAFYRRRGEPRNGISVMKSFIEEMIAGGIKDDSEELRPAFLLLSGCETDLARLAKSRKEPGSVVRAHYTAAQDYLQKVFGRADHLWSAESKHNFFDAQVLPGSLSQSDGRMQVEFSPQSSPKNPERDRSLRKLHDDQGAEIARLRTLKRQIEDDYSYERDLRRKYQRRLDDLEKECELARKMERYALDQIKREVATRRKAEERAESERRMRQELIQISDKRFGFDDIINLCEKKKQEAENISP